MEDIREIREIRSSKEYLFSLWTKIFILLVIFWGIVYLVLTLLESIGLNVEISVGNDNSVVISTLFIITFLISSIGAFIIYSIFIKTKILIVEDSMISIKEGIIKQKEVKINYKDLKDVHCDEDIFFGIIDKIFKISVLKIHGNDTYYIYGISNGEEISKEIRLRIDAHKEKKIDPIALLSEDIKNLKNEITELKSEVENLKKIAKHKSTKVQNQAKKRFALGPLGPFDEKI